MRFGMAWKAQLVRFSLFSEGQIPSGNASELWNEIFGKPPQTYQPVPGPMVISEATGPTNSASCSLILHPNRVDFNFSPIKPPQVDLGLSPTIAHLPSISDTISEGIEIVAKLKANFKINRLALSIDAMAPEDSHSICTEKMISELRLNSMPTDAIDLLFQFNVPIRVDGVEVEMNRLVTWGTATARLLKFHLTASQAAVPQGQVIDLPIRTLKLDLNSAPVQNFIFTISAFDAMWNALASEACKILDNPYGRFSS